MHLKKGEFIFNNSSLPKASLKVLESNIGENSICLCIKLVMF